MVGGLGGASGDERGQPQPRGTKRAKASRDENAATVGSCRGSRRRAWPLGQQLYDSCSQPVQTLLCPTLPFIVTLPSHPRKASLLSSAFLSSLSVPVFLSDTCEG